MYYAYVRFPADNEAAILPVSMVKDYNPKSDTDIPRGTVQAYWRSTAGEEEGYYEAKVVLLAKSKAALLEDMTQRKRMIIPQIFDEPLKASTSAPASSSKDRKRCRDVAKRKQLKEIISKKRPAESSDDDDPAVVPKADLDKAQDAIHSLRKRLRKAEEPKKCATCADSAITRAELEQAQSTIEQLRGRLGEVEHANFRLTRALLNKIGKLSSTFILNLLFSGDSTPVEERSGGSSTPQPVGNQSPLALEDGGEHEALSAGPHGAAGTAECEQPGDISYPPLFAVLDGQVHLGHGITMAENTLKHALSHATTPGRFVRMVARGIWEHAELFDRSVTGQACRRLLKDGAVGKVPLTPVKVDAVTVETIKTKNAAILWLAVAYGRYAERQAAKEKEGEKKEGTNKKEKKMTHKKNGEELTVKDVVKKLLGDYMVDKNREEDRAKKIKRK
ncbi:unnamed protein product, partial [Ixodes hexagonus]